MDASNPDEIQLATSYQNATATKPTAITLTSTGGHSQQSFRPITANSHTFNAANNVEPASAVSTISVVATNPFTLKTGSHR